MILAFNKVTSCLYRKFSMDLEHFPVFFLDMIQTKLSSCSFLDHPSGLHPPPPREISWTQSYLLSKEEHRASVFYNILPAQHPLYSSISLSSDLHTPTSTHTKHGHMQTTEE